MFSFPGVVYIILHVLCLLKKAFEKGLYRQWVESWHPGSSINPNSIGLPTAAVVIPLIFPKVPQSSLGIFRIPQLPPPGWLEPSCSETSTFRFSAKMQNYWFAIHKQNKANKTNKQNKIKQKTQHWNQTAHHTGHRCSIHTNQKIQNSKTNRASLPTHPASFWWWPQPKPIHDDGCEDLIGWTHWMNGSLLVVYI